MKNFIQLIFFIAFSCSIDGQNTTIINQEFSYGGYWILEKQSVINEYPYNVLHGTTKSYDKSTNKLLSITNFKNGEKHGQHTFYIYPDDKFELYPNCKNKTYSIKEYYNGTLIEKKDYTCNTTTPNGEYFLQAHSTWTKTGIPLKFITYYSMNKKMKELQTVGVCKEWYENGNLYKEWESKGDVDTYESYYKEYYESGILAKSLNFVEGGNPEGEQLYYNTDGKLQKQIYIHPNMDKNSFYYEELRIHCQFVKEFNSSNFIVSYYSRDSVLKYYDNKNIKEINLNRGNNPLIAKYDSSGFRTFYSSNDTLISYYEKGKIQEIQYGTDNKTFHQKYQENGILILHQNKDTIKEWYTDGKPKEIQYGTGNTSFHQKYQEDGILIYHQNKDTIKEFFSNGMLSSYKTGKFHFKYFENGQMSYYYKNDSIIEYYGTGQVYLVGKTINTKKEGEWKEFTSDGSLWNIYQYKNGKEISKISAKAAIEKEIENFKTLKAQFEKIYTEEKEVPYLQDASGKKIMRTTYPYGKRLYEKLSEIINYYENLINAETNNNQKYKLVIESIEKTKKIIALTSRNTEEIEKIIKKIDSVAEIEAFLKL